jgi:hypothetical protein
VLADVAMKVATVLPKVAVEVAFLHGECYSPLIA